MLRRAVMLSFALAGLVCGAGCESYFFLPGTFSSGTASGLDAGTFGGEVFSEELIQGRTFFNGKAVTTLTYQRDDNGRTPFGVDFNGDGKIDPVAVYSLEPLPAAGVIQILLSQGAAGEVDYLSLTLDGNNGWEDLVDVAVGDIDNDGAPDIVAASTRGVIYLRNPGPGQETVLRDWGADTPELEFLAGSTDALSREELEAIITQVVPPGVSIDQYDVSLEQGYTNVEIADLNRDLQNDVVASRRLKITMTPKPDTNVEPLLIITGAVQIFTNPGNALDGGGWGLAEVGQHERGADLDREGASSLLAYDMDGDGDLDVVSAARDDDNVQLAWFENPGLANFFDVTAWTQWRIGSIRDAIAFDIADVTSDGRPDVVATGGLQKQLVLFVQPETGARREFDWDTHPIATFESFEPRDVKALDIDDDGVTEVVLGGTEGAVRYFEPGSDPTAEWDPIRILDFDPAGEVGLIGFGDLDGDGDFDLVTVLDDATEDTGDRVSWIRNNTR